ncbi:glycerophosphodiester phosphodiesterase [Undibacterium sp. RuTC16W]|uniref:glycerophosphodiester phosphodiesterase n=1 Tax=Undibacterium sp. RuTC16W TaxID=3413048 RepID=UPI003BF455F9
MINSRRSFLKTALVSGGVLSLDAAGFVSQALASSLRKVELFAHRGASALRPEHTLAAYAKAIADGADYIEPDLVSTRDGVLVARHEAILDETTDVSQRPEFAVKRTTKTIDGRTHTGWFCDDFTLSELKSLRAVERLPKVRPQNTFYDRMFQILTWDEIIDFAAAESATVGRLIGLVPELKHSTYFAKVGLPLEDRFLKSLTEHEYTKRCPLEIQSFEVANLKYIRSVIGKKDNIRLMQLVAEGNIRPADVVAAGGDLNFGAMSSKAGLRDIARYADVVAPPTRALIPLLADGKLGQPTALINDAHDAGLLVHTWTFRPENRFLAADFRDSNGENARNEIGSIAEIRRYIDAGIDGFFSDDSAIGRKAINA